MEKVGKTNFFNIFGLEGLKKVGFSNFFNFFNFSTKKSWPQRLSFRKCKVEKVVRNQLFQDFRLGRLEVGFSNSTFSTFPQRSLGPRDFLSEKFEKVGKPTFFKASNLKMLKKLGFPTSSPFIVFEPGSWRYGDTYNPLNKSLKPNRSVAAAS